MSGLLLFEPLPPLGDILNGSCEARAWTRLAKSRLKLGDLDVSLADLFFELRDSCVFLAIPLFELDDLVIGGIQQAAPMRHVGLVDSRALIEPARASNSLRPR